MRANRSTVQAVLTPGAGRLSLGADYPCLPAIAPSTLVVTSLSGGVTTYDAVGTTPPNAQYPAR